MRVTKAAPFIFRKRGIFYFTRRIPSDLSGRYRCSRVTISLRTRSLRAAQACAAALAGKLDQDWLSLRWQSKDDQFSRFLSDRVVAARLISSAPTLSEAAKLYVEAKQKGRSQTFHQAADRVVSRMIAVAGDKPIDTFTREEANALRNGLRVDPIMLGKGSQALLTILSCSTHCLCHGGAAVENLALSASFHSLEQIAPSNAGTKHLAARSYSSMASTMLVASIPNFSPKCFRGRMTPIPSSLSFL